MMFFEAKKDYNEEVIEFIEARMKGAEKIMHAAEDKSGAPKLTYYHFHAKVKTYRECLRLVKRGEDYNELKRLLNSTLNHASINKTAKEFQETLGEAEVYGEIAIFMKNL